MLRRSCRQAGFRTSVRPPSHRRPYVGVHVGGELDAGVSEPFADDLRVLAGRRQERGAGVAQVIQAKVFGELGAFEDRAEAPALKVAGHQRPASGRGEDEILLPTVGARLQPRLSLFTPVLLQGAQRRGRRGD